MRQYQELLSHLLYQGTLKGDRTGTGTISAFGYQMRFDLNEGFPLVTTKKVNIRAATIELLWFLRGGTNIRYLNDCGVHIWDAWADHKGSVGPMYGRQWREWDAGRTDKFGNWILRDQIAEVIEAIKTNPDSRRLVVSAWNVADLPDESKTPQENARNGKMALAPCHALFQFYVADGKLSCQLYQRSADAFIGLPFNIASYALLTHMVAQQCGLAVGDFIWTGGDVHLYLNHLEQAREQLSREPRALPILHLSPAPSIDDYTILNFRMEGYNPHPALKAEVAV